MYKLILLIAVLGLVFYKQKIVEPIVASCCGGVQAHENHSRAPRNIRRCLKNEEWYMPCTNKGSPDCCSGEDRCIPSSHGGKCQRKNSSGHYIYSGDEQEEYDRSRHDTEVYEDDDDYYEDDYRRRRSHDDDDVDGQELFDKLINLDYLNYFIIFCICVFILYLIYHLFIEKHIETGSHYSSHHSYQHSSHHKPSYSRYSDHNRGKSWRR